MLISRRRIIAIMFCCQTGGSNRNFTVCVDNVVTRFLFGLHARVVKEPKKVMIVYLLQSCTDPDHPVFLYALLSPL